MKEFNWEDFKDENNKIAVHCKTEDEAKDFCKQMCEHEINWIIKWFDIGLTYYDVHKKETCYTCTGYSRSDFYKGEKYKIIEWSDYMKKEFTKADLKDGMVVEYRNGERRLVLGDRIVGNNGYNLLGSYNETLEDIQLHEKQYDIVRVYQSRHISISQIFSDSYLELIWERNETKKMTAEEMRKKLEELTGEKIEIEPSTDEKYCKIDRYCNERVCSECCLGEDGCTCEFKVDDKKSIEECYKKIMEQEK